MGQRVYEFTTWQDDVVTTGKTVGPLPRDWHWLPESFGDRVKNTLVTGFFRRFGAWGVLPALHWHLVGGEKLAAQADSGVFLYANHTQPLGDAFVPLVIGGRRPSYVLANNENRTVPILGPIIQYGGALVIPSDIHQLKAFNTAVSTVISQEHAIVMVYPEAHVWPYATMIRPFANGAFHHPVANHAPVFTLTTTYQRRKHGEKPRATAYVDGPFWPDEALPLAKRRAALAAQVKAAMVARSQASTYTYVTYEQRGGAE